MSTGGNGTCTWTYDGTFWTCVDHCADGKACNDIVQPSLGVFTTQDPITAGDPQVQTHLKAVKMVTLAGGKMTPGVPDPLFRRVAVLRGLKTHPALTDPAFATQHKAATAARPVVVVVDCI